MYLHIGKEILVNSEDIIGIFDFNAIIEDKKEDLYLNKKYYKIIDLSDGNSRTLIIIQKDKKNYAYVSNILGETLKNRLLIDKNRYKQKRKEMINNGKIST